MVIRRTAVFFALFLSLLASSASPAFAQPAAATARQTRDPLHVLLITMGPGADPWEKFGHNAIEIVDLETGSDRCYNWGVFSFGEGVSGFLGFTWHFLQGRLWYSMQSDPAGPMLEAYADAGRSVLVQELQMTHEQKAALQHRLQAQDTDANRYYLYDYFLKNCSTMARDAIDQTVDGRVAAALRDVPTGTTYRWHDRRLTADELWLYTFLDFALGHPIDHELSEWQESFLPMKLATHLREVRVPDPDGHLVPLVMWEKQLAPGAFQERDTPPRYFFWGFLATGLAIGGALYALGRLGQRFLIGRIAFWIIAFPLLLFLALLGSLATWAWFTDHAAAHWNENWLQVNPSSLVLLFAIFAARRWPRVALRCAAVVVALSAFGLVIKILPWFRQPNAEIIALVLPLHVGMLLGLAALAHRRPKAAAQQPDALTSAPSTSHSYPRS